VEKKMGMVISKEWTNNEVTYFDDSRQKRLLPLRKRNRETAGHNADTKLISEAEKELL
jgi:hypothetical protein